MNVHVAPFQLKLVSPMGTNKINVKYVMMDALYIEGRTYPIQLILLDMTEFDIILGKDWLVQYNMYIDCHKLELVVGKDNEQPVIFIARKPQPNELYTNTLRGLDQIQGTDPVSLVWWAMEEILTPNVQEIPMVNKYPDVFPEKLPRLSLEREFELSIELVSDV